VLLARARRECVRAMAAFLNNDYVARVRGRLVITERLFSTRRAARQQALGSYRSGTGRRPEALGDGAAIRNGQDGPCATIVACLYL